VRDPLPSKWNQCVQSGDLFITDLFNGSPRLIYPNPNRGELLSQVLGENDHIKTFAINEIFFRVILHYVMGSNYMPPSQDMSEPIGILGNFLTSHVGPSRLVICGDFNINLLCPSRDCSRLNDVTTEAGLTRAVNSATRIEGGAGSLFDNIYLNFNVEEAKVLYTSVSDHLAPCIMFRKVQTRDAHKIRQSARLFPEDIQKIKVGMQEESWQAILQSNDVDEAYNSLVQKLQDHLQTASTKRPGNRRTRPVQKWMTRGLLQSRTVLNKLRVKSVQKRTPANLFKYRKIYQQTMRKAKDLFYQNQLCLHFKNGKKVWEIVNEITERTTRSGDNFPTSLAVNNCIIKEPRDIANGLNSHFISIAAKLCAGAERACSLKFQSEEILSEFEPVPAVKIQQILERMKPKASTGHDGLSTKLLKCLKEELCVPIAHVVNI